MLGVTNISQLFNSILSVCQFIKQENSERIQDFLEVLNNLLGCLNEVIEPLENGERDSIPQEELEGNCKGARIPGHEIKERLKTGQIAAAEWIGPHEDMQLGIHKLPEELNNTWYYYYPGWWEPSTTFSLHVNKNSWKDLGQSGTYQEIFKSACSRVLYEKLAEYNEKNGQALADLTDFAKKLEKTKQGRIEIRRFSPKILEAAEKATSDYFQKDRAADDLTPIWNTFQDFKEKIRQWAQMEAYYVNYKDYL